MSREDTLSENMDYVNDTLDKVQNILKSKEMLCACYLYDYYVNANMESYRSYKKIYDELNDAQKELVYRCVLSFNDNEICDKLNSQKTDEKKVR